MTSYAVIRKSDSQQVYQYAAEVPIEWNGMEFSTHDHIQVAEPVPAQLTPQPRILTRLEFLRRFTGAERVTLRTIAKTNAALEDYMALLDAAQDVNTGDPDTIFGVQMLEAAGLIAAGRAQEILNG